MTTVSAQDRRLPTKTRSLPRSMGVERQVQKTNDRQRRRIRSIHCAKARGSASLADEDEPSRPQEDPHADPLRICSAPRRTPTTPTTPARSASHGLAHPSKP